MIVVFPVSPITRKILLAEYGEEPIKLKSHDIIFQQLTYKHPRPKVHVKKLKEKLTTTIQISLQDRTAKSLSGNGFQIGYHLLCHHMDMLMRHVYAQVLVDIEATVAIRSFYNMYDLTEDDYEEASAYKRWQRYQKSKKAIKNGINVRNNLRRLVLRDSNLLILDIPPSDKELDLLIVNYCSDHFHYFQDQKGFFNITIFKHFAVYIYYTVGKTTVDRISKKMQISISSAYYSIDYIKSQLDVDEDFSFALDQFLPSKVVQTA